MTTIVTILYALVGLYLIPGFILATMFYGSFLVNVSADPDSSLAPQGPDHTEEEYLFSSAYRPIGKTTWLFVKIFVTTMLLYPKLFRL